MFDMSNPLSAFSEGSGNAASFAIAQRESDIENAVAYIIDLYDDDVNAIEDEEIFYSVLKKYNLNNLSSREEKIIINEIQSKVRQRTL